MRSEDLMRIYEEDPSAENWADFFAAALEEALAAKEETD